MYSFIYKFPIHSYIIRTESAIKSFYFLYERANNIETKRSDQHKKYLDQEFYP